jgi:signal peptidase II
MSLKTRAILTVLLVLFLDQALKVWVKTNMFLYQDIYVAGNWFIIKFIENNGMAFGINLPGEYGKLMLTSFRIIAAIGIIYYLGVLIKQKVHPGLIITISLILAGAVGNIIDSAFYGMIFSDSSPFAKSIMFPPDGGYSSFLHGRVVDMFYFPVLQGTWPEWVPFKGGESFEFFRPVFNIADASITIGVVTIMIFQKRFFAGTATTATPAPSVTSETSAPSAGSEPSEPSAPSVS